MVKIANKLDSLGLTKEADVLDRYIQKMAAGPATTAPGNILYEDGRAATTVSDAPFLNKFYASKPETLSEFNGLLGGLLEEIGKIPGQKVFSDEIMRFPPKKGDTTWSGATNLAFKEYAKAAGFPEAGTSWKNFALKNSYQPTLFGIYSFWEDTISKVVEKAESDFSTTFSIGAGPQYDPNAPILMPGEPQSSSSAQASRPPGGGPITEERAPPAYRPGSTDRTDAKLTNP
jgi:hypothetical protein